MGHYISVPKKLTELLSKMSILAQFILFFHKWLCSGKTATFLASNHQTLTTIEELKPFLQEACLRTLKNSIFVKSLNFIAHGTPQTAFRAAIRRLELSST